MSKLIIIGALIIVVSGFMYIETTRNYNDCLLRNFGHFSSFMQCFHYAQYIQSIIVCFILGVLVFFIGVVQSFLKKRSQTNINSNIHYGDKVDMSGNFENSAVNIKSQLSGALQHIEEMSINDPAAKAQLKQLLIELSNELQRTPADKIADAEAVAETAKQLVDQATKDKPNKTLVQISTKGFRQTVENIANVIPTVLSIRRFLRACSEVTL